MGRPAASSPDSLLRMKAQRQQDTAPEMALRSALHARGLRFRIHVSPIPDVRRKADIVFRPARVAIFVDGCFWHGCPKHGTLPKANREWWEEKLAANRVRDADTDKKLRASGWFVVRVWEHADPLQAADRIAARVRSRRPAGNSRSRRSQR